MAPTSVLSDGTIRELVAAGRIKVEPWDAQMVQPASIDLRLGDSFRVFHNHRITAIDLRDPPGNLTEEVVPPAGEPFVIHPGEFCLGNTLELNNLTRVPIKLYPGLPIAQLSFMTLDRAAQVPYGSPQLGSHYQGQRAATESRYEGGRGAASA